MSNPVCLVHDLILYKMEKGDLNLETKEALKSVLQEFEAHTKLIEHQLKMCKKDQIELQADMTELVTENKHLSTKLKSIKGNPHYTRKENNLTDSSEVIENLEQQLALATEEKETLEGLWKSSLKEVDVLKEKLKDCQSGKQLSVVKSKLSNAQQDYTEAIKILESRLSAIKTENDHLNAKIQVLENQLLQVSSQMATITEQNLTLTNSLKEVTAKEQEWKSQYLNLEAKYIELERSYQADKVKFSHVYDYEKVETNLKEKLEGALRQRDELQTALERCHERMAEMLRNSANDRNKVEEALTLVEGVLQDRDEALQKESISAEEVKKIKTELSALVEEAGQQVAQATITLKKQFENQLTALKDQLKIVEQERDRKSAEVQQWQKECEKLQSLLHQKGVQGITGDRDKHLDRIYQELHKSESECLQLKVENEGLQDTIRKLHERCRKSRRGKDKLKHELLTAEQQTQLLEHELAVTNEKAELFNTQLNQLKLVLAQIQSEVLIDRADVVTPQPKVSVTNTLELYKRLDDSYTQMNDKWKKEINSLTEKFEARLKELKAKNKKRSVKEETAKKSN